MYFNNFASNQMFESKVGEKKLKIYRKKKQVCVRLGKKNTRLVKNWTAVE